MVRWYHKVKEGWLGQFGTARYVTTRDVEFWPTGIFPLPPVVRDHVSLDRIGRLVVLCGFEFDGPSGPTLDDPQNMAPSLCHDALYAMGKDGLLPDGWRAKADRLMRVQMLERRTAKKGTFGRVKYTWQTARAWYYWGALRIFGGRILDGAQSTYKAAKRVWRKFFG